MGVFGASPSLPESATARANRLNLIDGMLFELVPIKNLSDAVAGLPPGARVSVTCSPVKGILETQRIVSDLAERGFAAVPHISARLVRNRAHTAELAGWFRSVGVTEAFVIAGDVAHAGDYAGATEFLRDLLDTDHGLTTVGLAGYPDGHPFLSLAQMHEALHAKQVLLADARVHGYCSTQMCFDPAKVVSWIRGERDAGLTLPVHLGVSGVVDRKKLLATGMRLGIGQSLSYLKKNRVAVTKLLTSASFDPSDLLLGLSEDLESLGVRGLHVFTFNQVEATNAWRLACLRL